MTRRSKIISALAAAYLLGGAAVQSSAQELEPHPRYLANDARIAFDLRSAERQRRVHDDFRS